MAAACGVGVANACPTACTAAAGTLTDAPPTVRVIPPVLPARLLPTVLTPPPPVTVALPPVPPVPVPVPVPEPDVPPGTPIPSEPPVPPPAPPTPEKSDPDPPVLPWACTLPASATNSAPTPIMRVMVVLSA